jgi:DNA-directed RNA polymerase specialized sigma24 family protein
MHLAGYPREEIGRMLGWTDAKTRNLIYRGLTEVRSRLTAQGIRPDEGAA